MKKLFSYFYYRIYDFFRFLLGKKDFPEITTLIYIVFISQHIVFITVDYFGYKNKYVENDGVLWITVLLTFIFYYFTIRKKIYIQIFERFRNEHKILKILGRVFIVIFTFSIIILGIYI